MAQEDVKISDEFREVYDAAVKLWADLDIAIRGSADDGQVSTDAEVVLVGSLHARYQLLAVPECSVG